jgi:N6-L-threonylcarbamoyladenine synthase
MSIRILGIESSCDETGVAIYDADRGLIADALHSQIDTHSLYGGVVPELASRDHVRFLVKLVDDALRQADLSKQDIDGVAYTAGPGLVGALLTGACFAKSLAFSLNKPAIAVHHLEAHILAAQLDNPQLDFPFLVLLVSGGHTQLLQATALGEYLLLGETLDDAVGEAFDKTAKLMGFPYPGGALLAQLADECLVDARQMLPRFPRPMLDRPGLDFSFSGLKTHALTTWNNSEKNDLSKKAIAYAFQEAVVETLVTKSLRAIEQSGIKTLVVAGGVAANHTLRANLTQQITKAGGSLYFPRLQFCTDNGAMIAYAGFLRFQSGQMDNTLAIEVKARWPL